MSYAKLASVYRASNETAKASEALASGRAIIAKLVGEHPDWAQWKQDLAWFDAQIAELSEDFIKTSAEAMSCVSTR